MDGELVGTSVGFSGALEGDWLGLEVGCSDVKVESKKYHVRYPLNLSMNNTTHTYTQQMLTSLDGELVGTSVGFSEALEGDWLGLEVGCKIDNI